MGRRAGTANLPLHGGRVPPWLATRMARLGRVIVEAIALEWGRDEVLRRLSHPFWFQSFGAVMGMDWHSSGITTSVIGALKRGLGPVEDELGIYVCGGRGRHSRKTPDELRTVAERQGLDGEALARTSRLVAKLDSAAVQDGYQIYLHSFIVTADGAWTVVQQGMNGADGQARRYHWLSEGLESFVDDPHAAVDGVDAGEIINLLDARAARTRQAEVELVNAGPDGIVRALGRLGNAAPAPKQAPLPHLHLPAHHDVRPEDLVTRRLWGALAAAADRGPRDFETLLLTPGIGARTVEALTLVAEVVYGTPARFTDPARFSYALGGKDGHPFPVPLTVYDQTIGVMRRAVDRATLGNDDRLKAVERLDHQARLCERVAQGLPWDALVARERARSYAYGGRTVMGKAQPPRAAAKRAAPKGQLALFG